MAKRVEPEVVIVNFFNDADAGSARTLFAIVKGIVEKRGLLQERKKTARGNPKATPEIEQK